MIKESDKSIVVRVHVGQDVVLDSCCVPNEKCLRSLHVPFVDPTHFLLQSPPIFSLSPLTKIYSALIIPESLSFSLTHTISSQTSLSVLTSFGRQRERESKKLKRYQNRRDSLPFFPDDLRFLESRF